MSLLIGLNPPPLLDSQPFSLSTLTCLAVSNCRDPAEPKNNNIIIKMSQSKNTNTSKCRNKLHVNLL